VTKAGGQHVGQQVGVATVGVEVGVEDGDLGADGGWGESGEQCGQFLGVEPARIGTIHRGQVFRVEHVHVEVEPIPRQVTPAHDGASSPRGALDPVLADLPGRDDGAEELACLGEVFVVVASADVHHVGR
jgi:hypothetical protein